VFLGVACLKFTAAARKIGLHGILVIAEMSVYQDGSIIRCHKRYDAGDNERLALNP